jgi:hypothetical protein
MAGWLTEQLSDGGDITRFGIAGGDLNFKSIDKSLTYHQDEWDQQEK